jgi:hypothetical protein
MDRRRFLGATAAAAGATSLAGCSTAVGSVPRPNIPQSKLDEGGWKKVSDEHRTVFERDFSGVTVTAKAHSVTYEDAALRKEIVEKTLDQVSGEFSLFSATRIDMAPGFDELPVAKDRILDQTEESARQQFEAQMENAGLSNVEQADTGTLTVDTGEDARLTTYEATFPVPTMTFPVTDDRTMEIEGDDLRVRGDLAVWQHGDFVLVAGGAHPGENFARDISKELSEAIEVSVSIDLGLTPDEYSQELRRLITAVQ